MDILEEVYYYWQDSSVDTQEITKKYYKADRIMKKLETDQNKKEILLLSDAIVEYGTELQKQGFFAGYNIAIQLIFNRK